MITKLQIKNFKIWEDTDEIRLAPITLFFGTNSSGKSSIGQFLMMLKQTAEQSDRQTVLNPGGNHTPVQLGSFREMVSHRNVENKIAFSYSWRLPDTLKITDSITKQAYQSDSMCFDAIIGVDATKRAIPTVQQFSYQLDTGDNPFSVKMKKNSKGNYDVTADLYKLVRNQGRAWPIKTAVRFYGFPDDVVAYYQNAEFVQQLNLAHESMLSTVSYLGPLRTKTERLYTWAGIQPESVGTDGRNMIPAMLAAKERIISPRKRVAGQKFEHIIATQLKNLGLIDEIQVNEIVKNRQEYEVRVKTKGSGDFVDLPDVGFGISQVLPVLVQCFYAQPGSIILMEQPEIHLHPSAQSALADVMIDVMKSRENGNDRNIQLIIETHSEHFLRRFQRRIAEEQIAKEDFAAYVVDTTSTPAQLQSLDVDLYGEIRNWPKDFFGDEMGDVIAQTKAAAQRRIKNAKKGGSRETT